MNNYVILRDRLPMHKFIWFFDVDQSIFTKTCMKHQVWFSLKQVFTKPNTDYHACICCVRKKDLEKLPDIMDEVTRTITLLGYKDYEEYSVKTIEDMFKVKEEMKNGQKN